jgi:hypothetical protein
MASRELERIRSAILDGRYTLTEHAYDEMDEDDLDVLDVEAAILTGRVDQTLTHDPRAFVLSLLATPRISQRMSALSFASLRVMNFWC